MKLHQIDWLGFSVRFICGAILGVLIGIGRCAHGDISEGSVPQIIAGCLAVGVLIGLLAAIFGDDFWKGMWWWN